MSFHVFSFLFMSFHLPCLSFFSMVKIHGIPRGPTPTPKVRSFWSAAQDLRDQIALLPRLGSQLLTFWKGNTGAPSPDFKLTLQQQLDAATTEAPTPELSWVQESLASCRVELNSDAHGTLRASFNPPVDHVMTHPNGSKWCVFPYASMYCLFIAYFNNMLKIWWASGIVGSAPCFGSALRADPRSSYWCSASSTRWLFSDPLLGWNSVLGMEVVEKGRSAWLNSFNMITYDNNIYI